MRQLQPVLWTKGLILSPQHLQTQDRFFEDNLGFQLAAVSPWPWGFQRLELDIEALPRGELIVTEATGALPDGAVFAVPEADGHVPPRSVLAAWVEDRPTLTAHLALPEPRSNGRNVAILGEDLSTRYVADVIRRRDENTGLAERELQVARKNLRIVFESESLEGYTSLPLTRLTRTPSGEFVVDPSFIPPLLSTGGSPRLLSIVERLVELLITRGSSLSSVRRQRSGNLAHFSVSDVANFWLLFTINSNLPLLRHLAEKRAGHPSELFEAMLGLAGSLSTFSNGTGPRDFPAYNHSDPGPAFIRLEEILSGLLETAVPENCVAKALSPIDQNVHAASLDEDRLLRPSAVYLAIRAKLTPAELVRRAQDLKLSSGDRLQTLIRQGLPGAPLTHIASPPPAVPIRMESQYFEVSRAGSDWAAVVQSRNVAVYAPSDLGEIALELIVLLPERS